MSKKTNKTNRKLYEDEHIDFEDRRNQRRSKRKVEKQYLRDMIDTDGKFNSEVFDQFDEFEENQF